MEKMREQAEERRGGVRAPLILKVEYPDADNLVSDFTNNISKGGTFIHTRQRFEIGTPLRVCLSFPGLIKPIPLSGKVKWVQQDRTAPGVGVAFDEVTSNISDRLTILMDRISSSDPKLLVRHYRVLLVEDNPHVALLVREALCNGTKAELGGRVTFDFCSATDGQEALDKLGTEQYDLLVTDIYLPVVDGVEVIKHTKASEHLADIPIIAMSAGGMATQIEALEAGADFFLAKPMRLVDIVATMRTLAEL